MITNFKLFETENDGEYNVTDYVLIDINEIKKDNEKQAIEGTQSDAPDKMSQIISINHNSKYPYFVKFFNDKIIQVRQIEILRKLTPDEILEFESKKDAIKYNL